MNKGCEQTGPCYA